MNIKIIASDSMGVRSLATIVETGDFKICIDPGMALSPKRFGFPPHIKELNRFKELRKKLLSEVINCNYIFISHFHHDHFVPFYLKEYVLSGFNFAESVYGGKKVFIKSPYNQMNFNQKQRGKKLIKEFKRRRITFSILEEEVNEIFSFFGMLFHGNERERGSVGAFGISYGGIKFLYLSDSQFLDERVLDFVKEFKPDILLSSGPPTYLNGFSEDLKVFSKNLIRKVSNFCGTLVIDHHLIRSGEYEIFLEDLSLKNIITAASFMDRRDEPLERERKKNFISNENR